MSANTGSHSPTHRSEERRVVPYHGESVRSRSRRRWRVRDRGVGCGMSSERAATGAAVCGAARLGGRAEVSREARRGKRLGQNECPRRESNSHGFAPGGF